MSQGFFGSFKHEFAQFVQRQPWDSFLQLQEAVQSGPAVHPGGESQNKPTPQGFGQPTQLLVGRVPSDSADAISVIAPRHTPTRSSIDIAEQTLDRPNHIKRRIDAPPK